MLEENWDMSSNSQAFIEAMIRQSIIAGLANSRSDVFNRYLELARRLYDRYHAERRTPTPTADQQRMSLGRFDQMVHSTYIRFMMTPNVHPLMKSRVWRATPATWRQQVYERLEQPLDRLATAAGLQPHRAFPPPPGVEAGPEGEPSPTPSPTGEAPTTVERQ
jgi:hypothetical protein